MLGLVQRVKYAEVHVAGQSVGRIEQGAMVLVGMQPSDNKQLAEKLAHKLLNYRLFADADGKTNLSLQDINGGLLLVPQFTLAADTRKGLRPSFSSAAPPVLAKQLFDYLVEHSRTIYHNVEQGQFGADMQVSLCNDGPVTYSLEIT